MLILSRSKRRIKEICQICLYFSILDFCFFLFLISLLSCPHLWSHDPLVFLCSCEKIIRERKLQHLSSTSSPKHKTIQSKIWKELLSKYSTFFISFISFHFLDFILNTKTIATSFEAVFHLLATSIWKGGTISILKLRLTVKYK